MRDLLSAGIPLSWVGGIAAAALVVGLLLIISGRSMHRRRGLTDARTLDLDGRNRYSPRLGLTGRPDRILEESRLPIPEEWKSTRRIHDSHRLQLGAYFILIEEETRIRPPHGYIVLGDVHRHRVENTDQLRARVLAIADQIRAARRDLAEIGRVLLGRFRPSGRWCDPVPQSGDAACRRPRHHPPSVDPRRRNDGPGAPSAAGGGAGLSNQGWVGRPDAVEGRGSRVA